MSRVNRKLPQKQQGDVAVTKLGFGKEGMRKLRCPRCQAEVAVSTGTDGKPLYKCTCGSVFKSVKF
jgi:uncharacterized C2H2 Zn-finger protein